MENEKYVIAYTKADNKGEVEKCYVKYFKNIDYIRYAFNMKDATFFNTRQEAKKVWNKFRHKENWEVRKIKWIEEIL